ncbi:DUF6538 domain-containing protein [Roseivivax sp. CAU 1753]
MRYHPSTLYLPKAKGKWYVRVTVPQVLIPHYRNKQLARSTGTSDRAEARLRQHEITARIYAEFDSKLSTLLQEETEKDVATFAQAMGVRQPLGEAASRPAYQKLYADAQYVLSNQQDYSKAQVEAAMHFVLVDTFTSTSKL